jgi:hypothetical protein
MVVLIDKNSVGIVVDNFVYLLFNVSTKIRSAT